MKFGKLLSGRVCPAWSGHYLDYKDLKKFIKLCHQILSTPQERHDAFMEKFNRQLEKLDDFFLVQISNIENNYKESCTLLRGTAPASHKNVNLEKEEGVWKKIDDMFTNGDIEDQKKFLEWLDGLCTHIDMLRSFITLNFVGCRKILKKFDKTSGKAGDSIKCQEVVMRDVVAKQAFVRSQRFALLLVRVDCIKTLISNNAKKRSTDDQKQTHSDLFDLRISMSALDWQCPICLDPLNAKAPVVLPCGHRFCAECIDDCRKLGHQCPVCRREYMNGYYNAIDNVLAAFLKLSANTAQQEDIAIETIVEAVVQVAASGGDGGEGTKQEDSDAITDAEMKRSRSRSNSDVEMKGSSSCSSNSSSSKGKEEKVESKPYIKHVSKTAFQGLEVPSVHPDIVAGEQAPVQLKAFKTLMEHATPKAYIIFDIDETVIVPGNFPCMLLSPYGIRSVNQLLQNKNGGLRLSTRHYLRQQVLEAVNTRKLIEPITADVINELQRRGVTVFCLTARNSRCAAQTRAELVRVGVDFSVTSPFPNNSVLTDPVTGAVCEDGIIFANNNHKGTVLNRFLEGFVFRPLYAFGGAWSDHEESSILPDRIVFVDDQLPNCWTVLRSLTCASRFRIPVLSYHYERASYVMNENEAHPSIPSPVKSKAPFEEAEMEEEEKEEPQGVRAESGAFLFDHSVLKMQLKYFMVHHVLLGDVEARRLLTNESKRRQQPDYDSDDDGLKKTDKNEKGEDPQSEIKPGNDQNPDLRTV